LENSQGIRGFAWAQQHHVPDEELLAAAHRHLGRVECPCKAAGSPVGAMKAGRVLGDPSILIGRTSTSIYPPELLCH
jgi:hypothetical protein